MATQPAAQPAWQTPMSDPSGGPAPGAPGQPAQNPMLTHVKVVAILEIVWGVLAAIAAVFFLFAFGVATAVTGGAGAPSFVPGFLAGMGIFLGLLIGALAALAIVAGMKLLKHQRSGRMMTYIVAAISLVSFPIGTAFGVYAFIILTRPDTDRLLVD